jgi:phage terminase large subunit-like protein
MGKYVYEPTRFMLPTSHYDKQRADRAVNFIQALRHTKGEFYNKPFMLLDWQETIIRDLFGIIREDGTRQFRQAIVFTPKKAGKTELAAAIALYLLCADGEQRAEIYGAAVDRQQASLIYSVAADMIRLTPALKKRCKILDSRKRIIFTPTNSFYQVLSSDADRAHGVSAHGVLIDEIHNQKNPDLFNVLTKGSGDARRQPIQFVISTAGDNIHSIGYELFQKAKDIIDGRKTDPTIYPVIYAADPDDDWTDPEVWKKANPSLGVTFPIEKLQEACDSAKQNPSEVNTFLQLRLNIWTKQAVRWMPMDRWDACNAPVDAEALRGRPCYAGLDLSSTQDLTALVLVFPPYGDDGKYSILPFAWVPEETIDQRSRKDHVNYDLWKKQGFILSTDGNVVDYEAIEEKIYELADMYQIMELAFDPWNSQMLVGRLAAEGMTVVPFRQGFASMSPPTKELMKMTLEGKLAHGGHPVLRWCMDNIVIQTDPAGNIKISKAKATEKVDLAVALVMALDRAIRNENTQTESVYEHRGLLFI